MRVGILGGFDVDAVRGAGGGAQEAADTLFVAVFVTLQDVDTAIARLDGGGDVGKALGGGLAEHGAQGDAEAFVEGEEGFADFLNDGGHQVSTLAESAEAGKRACGKRRDLRPATRPMLREVCPARFCGVFGVF